MKIIRRMIELQKLVHGFKAKQEQLSIIPDSQLDLAESYQVDLFSRVQLSQFYGIELDDFAHEIAQLSLWLAEHQMNVEFYDQFGKMNPTLPLKEAGKLVHGNSLKIDWKSVCPISTEDEVYVLGNPPYLGARNQNSEQKNDLQKVFNGIKGVNSLDYVCGWFLKAAKFINENSASAFVATNSINQGEQVSLLWPHIFRENIEITFAHKSFLWNNNAKHNAAVYVVIVGIRRVSPRKKVLYSDGVSKEVKNISPYLTDNDNVIVNKKNKPPNDVPPLVYGNQAIEGGNLIFETEEKDDLLKQDKRIEKFIRPLYGAHDFLTNEGRWCLWINESELEEAKEIEVINDQIKKVRNYRKNGGQVAKSLVHIPYRFRYIHEAKKSLLILPRTTTIKRDYLVAGIVKNDVVVTDAAQVVYDPEPYIFGFISSKIHMIWAKAVGGRLKMDIRYSNSLCYNTFPFPQISDQRKQEITQCVFRILEERENHPEKTLAQLYDPDNMPKGLLEAHQANDEVIEKCYRSRPFESDEQRLEYLFKQYEEMIEEEKQKETLFDKKKKKGRR